MLYGHPTADHAVAYRCAFACLHARHVRCIALRCVALRVCMHVCACQEATEATAALVPELKC